MPILLIFVLVEYKLAAVPSAYEAKRTYLEEGLGDFQVIITGSSHAYFGIRPQLLGVPAYSIAYVSQDIYYDTHILLKYLPQANNLKLVIVPVSYFTFENRLEDSTEAWRTSYYYRFWGIPHTMPSLKVSDYSYIALFGIPQVREYLWEGIPETTSFPINTDGSNVDQLTTNVSSVLDGSTTIKRHNSELSPKYVEQNEGYLDMLFAELKKRDISAVLLTTPTFHSYYENMDPEVYKVMQDQIKILTQKYQLQYYNYMADPRFTLYDFADSDHLNSSGAEKFSRILKYEVVEKYIK